MSTIVARNNVLLSFLECFRSLLLFKWRIVMNKEGIVIIDGIRYHRNRPKDCRNCYFWMNRKIGCSLGMDNCYYLAESSKKKSVCEGCCYGPCVSFCMKKVLGYKEVPVNA